MRREGSFTLSRHPAYMLYCIEMNLGATLANQVEVRAQLARQRTAAAVIYRKVKLVCFRQCMSSRSLIAIGQGIISIQDYCISYSDY